MAIISSKYNLQLYYEYDICAAVFDIFTVFLVTFIYKFFY